MTNPSKITSNKTIVEILGWDQICFRESTKHRNPIKQQLGFEQIERGDPLLKFMKEKYDINLKTT